LRFFLKELICPPKSNSFLSRKKTFSDSILIGLLFSS
jgi:hypothetical protein